ncbi:MAG: RidA family protein [Planctomycetota bacterium]
MTKSPIQVIELDGPLPVAAAVLHRGLLYFSGHVGYRAGTTEVVGPDLKSQTLCTLGHVDRHLHHHGVGRDRILMMRVYLADVQRDFEAFNQVFRGWIGDARHARTTVGATLAAPELLVEIDAIVALD